MRRRLPPALRERDFAFLWSAILGMGFANQMLAVAVGWQVYAIHRNPLDLGLIGLAEFLPLPILALPAGQLADRVPRKLIAAFAMLMSAGIASALVVVTLHGANAVWPFFVLAAAAGVTSAVGWPAFGALTPELVSAELSAGRDGAALDRGPDRRRHRAGRRWADLRVQARARVHRGRGALRRRARLRALAQAPQLHSRAGGRRAARPGQPHRRRPLRAADADAARGDRARPVRGALRRRHRAAARLRAVDPPCRAVRSRHPAHRARGGRPGRRCDPRAPAAPLPGGADADRGRRRVRREHGRLRPFPLPPALPRSARGQRLRRHDQHEHPLDDRRARDAERAPRARRRRRDGVHQRVQRARGLRVRRGRRARRQRDGGRCRAASRRSRSPCRGRASSPRSRTWAGSRTSGPRR